jgi:hypothetical protein
VVAPWFVVSGAMDRWGAHPAGIGDSPEANAMTPVFVAAATDPVIGRGLTRFWNLLVTPAELAADPAYMARCMDVMSRPEDYPMPPREGPTRDELHERLQEVGAWANTA